MNRRVCMTLEVVFLGINQHVKKAVIKSTNKFVISQVFQSRDANKSWGRSDFECLDIKRFFSSGLESWRVICFIRISLLRLACRFFGKLLLASWDSLSLLSLSLSHTGIHTYAPKPGYLTWKWFRIFESGTGRTGSRRLWLKSKMPLKSCKISSRRFLPFCFLLHVLKFPEQNWVFFLLKIKFERTFLSVDKSCPIPCLQVPISVCVCFIFFKLSACLILKKHEYF